MKLSQEETKVIMEMAFEKLERKYQEYQENKEGWSRKDDLINEQTYRLIRKCASDLKGISVSSRLEKYELWFNELDERNRN